MAMGRLDSTRTSATTDQEQFRTPDRAAAPSVLSSKLKRSSEAKTSARNTPLSSASTSRSWGRNSSFNAEAQPTLTQIDYVKVSQRPESEDELDYIRDPPRDAHSSEVIEIEDGSGDDADYHPPPTSKTNRVRGVRFEQGKERHTSSKRKNTPDVSHGEVKKGRRKSGDGAKANKKDRGIDKKERHKTLTQMKYVRRYVPVPDEDVNLEYTYITPEKKDVESQTTHNVKAEDSQPTQGFAPEASNPPKKRKLNAGLLSNKLEEPPEEKKAFGLPVTPKKALRSEIPSSQSPESPGLTFITSSQFRSATRSLQKQTPLDMMETCVKEESPDLDPLSKTGKSPLQSSTNDTVNKAPKSRGSSPGPRTVIYETDAETDYGDFQDDLPDPPSSPKNQELANIDDNVVDEDDIDDNSENIDSQELPPAPFSKPNLESGTLLSEINLMSDASICYQRLQPATQFPLEPIPTINTQKLAELFPEDSNELQTLTGTSMSSPSIRCRPVPDPQLETQTQTLTQSQSQSLERAKSPLDIIPESSPVTRHRNDAIFNKPGPSAPDAVVQVESSQPVDRLHKQANMGHDSGPRGVLSRSQILTSSVMESIPLPAFWMGSQDSIGEPYSLPEA